MAHDDVALAAAILEDGTNVALSPGGSVLRQTEGNAPMIRAAARVRLSGATNHDGSPSGINGDYIRTLNEVGGRPVYTKVGKASTAMWYHTVEGRHQWVVGPAVKIGTEKMWAYSERPISAAGPEAGGQSPWTLYCYQTKAWVRQVDVTVVDLEQRAREIEAVARQEKGLSLIGVPEPDARQRRQLGDKVTFSEIDDPSSWAGRERMKKAGQVDTPCDADDGPGEAKSQQDTAGQMRAAVEGSKTEVASNEAGAELERKHDETHAAPVAAQPAVERTAPGTKFENPDGNGEAETQSAGDVYAAKRQEASEPGEASTASAHLGTQAIPESMAKGGQTGKISKLANSDASAHAHKFPPPGLQSTEKSSDHSKEENRAAVQIQSMARGKSERKRHKERQARKQEPVKTEAEQAAEEIAANQAYADLDKAAVKIQSMARGKSERKRLADASMAGASCGEDDDWMAVLSLDMAQDLLHNSFSSLKDQGVLCSVSASEAASDAGSPLSRPVSRPISAVSSRPKSTPASMPGQEAGHVDVASPGAEVDQAQAVNHLNGQGCVSLAGEDQMSQAEEDVEATGEEGVGAALVQDYADALLDPEVDAQEVQEVASEQAEAEAEEEADPQAEAEAEAEAEAAEAEALAVPKERNASEASFQRSVSMDERAKMKHMATLQYLNMEDGEGVDILDLQREEDSVPDARAHIGPTAQVCNSM